MSEHASGVWWNQIAGPASVVNEVVDSLSAHQCVLLALPDHMPWPDPMRYAIMEKLQGWGLLIEDLTDEPGQPYEILLRRFAQGTVQTGYRPSSGRPQDYIAKHAVLNGKLLWLRQLHEERMNAWLDFIRSYRKCGVESGLILMEIGESKLPQQVPSHIKVVRYSMCVNDFDLLLFCSHIASEMDLSAGWKNYLAMLAAHLCAPDANLAEAYLKTNPRDHKQESPEEAFLELHKTQYGDSIPRPQVSALTGKVWQAQIKALFPLIEDERQHFIRRYFSRIKMALEAVDAIGPSGELIRDPLDAEWGLLFHLSHTRNDTGYYYLYIPDESEYNWVGFMRECRNKLAHGDVLSMGEVARIFK